MSRQELTSLRGLAALQNDDRSIRLLRSIHGSRGAGPDPSGRVLPASLWFGPLAYVRASYPPSKATAAPLVKEDLLQRSYRVGAAHVSLVG